MAISSEKIRQELEILVKQGKDIIELKFGIEAAKELVQRGNTEKNIVDLSKTPDMTATNYQKWYTQSLPVVEQLLPDRYQEFQEYYRLERRKSIDAATYTISDYFAGITITRLGAEVFNSTNVFWSKFNAQIAILESAFTRLDSILVNIKAVLQAQLFDDELSTANELLKKSHLRAAGAVAGVVIERHLGQVAAAHSITMHKKEPTISDFNDALKKAGLFDVPNWRFVQRLGDIRNLCVHSKEREPTTDEVEELNRGAEKIIKTLF